ncbi:uncharacterized protein CMU_036490 [Cryptosporidium muris RN66]|uniref:Uncharacterized protein n=1 Tax=Cryptosporidium muris (strain RN66) TaxID=441375 RepID=B6AGY4_CRYMR|nr:uncharacterized protein CMU_036490 [Cryptosporidium muris RN66]EEA07475.1 hypothetical protein CMU_036490 [Cryptosporidium muris RN66]|eukprot:XP_002141824.1 hypothetical protein [Cryptosporidium muris RN66]
MESSSKISHVKSILRTGYNRFTYIWQREMLLKGIAVAICCILCLAGIIYTSIIARIPENKISFYIYITLFSCLIDLLQSKITRVLSSISFFLSVLLLDSNPAIVGKILDFFTFVIIWDAFSSNESEKQRNSAILNADRLLLPLVKQHHEEIVAVYQNLNLNDKAVGYRVYMSGIYISKCLIMSFICIILVVQKLLQIAPIHNSGEYSINISIFIYEGLNKRHIIFGTQLLIIFIYMIAQYIYKYYEYEEHLNDDSLKESGISEWWCTESITSKKPYFNILSEGYTKDNNKEYSLHIEEVLYFFFLFLFGLISQKSYDLDFMLYLDTTNLAIPCILCILAPLVGGILELVRNDSWKMMILLAFCFFQLGYWGYEVHPFWICIALYFFLINLSHLAILKNSENLKFCKNFPVTFYALCRTLISLGGHFGIFLFTTS